MTFASACLVVTGFLLIVPTQLLTNCDLTAGLPRNISLPEL
ncbi:hypothetical protein [Phyllobacterium sp. SB3]